ncbi:InlB B-repeat-containing protein, partial [Candidatus Bathycorpusculum sp.]|uniref:InlB B-repeat-containing protein n=1 Tax=Candidatus Bathycorpusculum sp. TaxID=2994959 RepID=UPI002822AB41|nr:InlB B-repeat-containing protein [Candidatus Termitimicrobium sp.]MCL2685393.1 InlB B-repeat-containing protein [Candidatus Termitimicrobium sp.]
TVEGVGDLEFDDLVFVGWLYDGEIYNAGDSFRIFEDVELVAVWGSPSAYAISYVLSGGVNANGNPVSYAVDDLPLEIADPYRADSIFLYWMALYANGTEKLLLNSIIPQDVRGDIVLTAYWRPVAVYDIIYELEGGVNAPDNPVSYTVSDLPIAIADPTMEGYVFLGWMVEYADGSVVGPVLDFSVPVGTTGNIILTAQWIVVETESYSVIYDGNGYTSGTVPVDSNNPYDSGSQVTVLGLGSLSRSAHSFLGWTTSPNDTVVTYSAGSIFTITSDVVLYAVWQQATSPEPTPTQSAPVARYTVSYVPGAHGTFTEKTVRGLVYGDLTPAAPMVTGEAGWVFAGWSPVPSATVRGDVVYVAQWVQEQPALFTVKFMAWNGVLLTSQTVPCGGNATAPHDPTREGYTFIGWDRDYTNITSNLTVTAQYVADSEPPSLQVWALVNLILGIVGLILAIIVVICVLLKKKQKQKKEQDEQKASESQNSAEHKNERTDDEKTKKQKQHQILWLLSFILGIAGIIVFLLTENTSLPMALVDQWTIVNAIIFIVEIIAITLLIFNRKKKDDSKEDDNKNDTNLSTDSTLNNSNINNTNYSLLKKTYSFKGYLACI